MMDYIREAENKLKEYRYLEKSLNNLAAEINRLKWLGSPKDISAINYSSMGVSGGNKQMDALNIACAIADCKEIRLQTQKEIQRINTNLNFISREPGKEDYGELLRLWYIGRYEADSETGIYEYKKMSVEDICTHFKYSADSRGYFYDRKKDALRKFAKAYYHVRIN